MSNDDAHGKLGSLIEDAWQAFHEVVWMTDDGDTFKDEMMPRAQFEEAVWAIHEALRNNLEIEKRGHDDA